MNMEEGHSRVRAYMSEFRETSAGALHIVPLKSHENCQCRFSVSRGASAFPRRQDDVAEIGKEIELNSCRRVS